MISRELEVVFNLALKEAETRRHDLVSVEHLFSRFFMTPMLAKSSKIAAAQ